MTQGKWGELKLEKLVCQEEVGEEKGTLHIQGTMKFKNQTEFASVKKNQPSAHIEKTKNIMASIAYCSKLATRSGNIITFGDVGKMMSKNKPKKVSEIEGMKIIKKMLVEDLTYEEATR